MKIAILIPSTSRGRNWKSIKDSYLYNCLLKSLLLTSDSGHIYHIYLVIDNDDPIYSKTAEQNELLRFTNVFKKIRMHFLSSDQIPKGWVTHMWNKAFQKAYDDGCDYFFQCGDDIVFQDHGWVNNCIAKLQNKHNIGLTGPLDIDRWNTGPHCRPGGPRFIQTQSFVSRKHMEIFGFYFPPQIKNWYCDDWMTHVYYPGLFHQIPNFVKNSGGPPRYQIVGSLKPNCPIRKKCFDLVSKHRSILNNYLKNLPPSTSTSPST